jgi:hypothetical protein
LKPKFLVPQLKSRRWMWPNMQSWRDFGMHRQKHPWVDLIFLRTWFWAHYQASSITTSDVIEFESLIAGWLGNYCNLKIVSDVFYGWRLQTLIQPSGWTIGGAVIQWCRKFSFWFVSRFRLFCCFAGYCEGSFLRLFLWWSGIPVAQWKLFMSCVNHNWHEDFWGPKEWGWEEDVWGDWKI